jgi:carboxyl-terminal processing protease
VQTVAGVDRHMPLFADKARAGELKVTIQKFYRISGASTQLEGVVPDLQLPSVRNFMDFGEGSYDNPMPYDSIPALSYSYTQSKAFPLTELRGRLENRIKGNPDFAYYNDEALRYKQRIEKNTISLNADEREAERKANEKRRKDYEKGRDARSAALAKDGKGKIETLILTLDNPDFIAEADYTKEARSGIKAAEKASDDGSDNPGEATKIPYGVEPYKLETLHILRDMIELEKGSPTTAAAAAATPNP